MEMKIPISMAGNRRPVFVPTAVGRLWPDGAHGPGAFPKRGIRPGAVL
jgi:hypothetical protein